MIGHKTVKAKKNHECDYCDTWIEAGDPYETGFDTEERRTVRLHVVCYAAAQKRYKPGEEMLGDHRYGCWCDEDDNDCQCMRRGDK